jgi:hypothetical protein
LNFSAAVTGTANFRVYDANGRNVMSFQKEVVYEGNQEYDLSEYITYLTSGQYILTINIGDTSYRKEFVKADN